MALKIGDSIIANPVREDIAHAVDSTPHAADWRIALDNGEDDHMEACTAADGAYRVTFVDRGQRFDATTPVDSAVLKDILFEYLDGDTDWRDETRFTAAKSKGERARAARRITAKPPTWAIILVVASFVSLPIVLPLLPKSASGGAGILPIGLFVGGPMTVMLLAMIANKRLQLRRAAHWPQADGRITKSEVASRHQRRSGEAVEVVNVPAVAYEFSVGGRKYSGTRISIGEDGGGANTEATLAHYPLGAVAIVYFDPADPENCVLERAAPSFLPLQGCGTTLASLAALGFCGYWLFDHFDDVIAPLWRTGHGRVVLIATIIGVLSTMAYLGSLIMARQKGAPWPVVDGRIVESRTQINKRRSQPTYTPVVEYSYLVKGREFRSRRIGADDQSEDSRADADKITARFPIASTAPVYYDPANPSDAMLERPLADQPDRTALAIAAVSFSVAILVGGYFRS